MSDDVLNNCFTKPNIHAFPGGADSTQQVSDGSRATGQYAQAKQDYYTPLLNELHTRRRVLAARFEETRNKLKVLNELLGLLVD